ncbi:MAG TPA: hypothetical protein VGW10_08340, partial [Solirubrobacteraceae bacterium]|nr:hypothetical protein [Solirubrobacteraceae bacterium]
MTGWTARGAAVAALAALAAPGAAEAQRAPYTATPAPHQDTPRFAVAYEGRGTWRTRFHATPPNPDARHDVNDARDSSRQRWDVTYPAGVTVPACAAPCTELRGVTGARGVTVATARIHHTHDDGIYPELDRTVRCRLSKRTSRSRPLDASVSLGHDPATGGIAVTASNPLSTVLSLFPTACPRQGDSIDRILDNYAIPGFSFASGWGPERWFASGTVVIPSDVFHGSSRIAVRLADTRTGTPPRYCAGEHPS